MADKAIGELLEATTITQSDLFVLEQNGSAKKLSGQTFVNDMLKYLDGHGGIQSIAKVSTSGLQDTYRITFADLSTYDFIVTNGAKGDKGDNSYVWIKYASKNPTQNSDIYDTPDDWMGIYSGNSASAPTSYTAYRWFNIKGVKGDTGNPATLANQSVAYQSSASGTVIPSGNWYTEVPSVPPGNFLWTRTTIRFNSGSPVVSYSVSRYGIDGSGSVASVNNVSPDGNGNVTLRATDVGALPDTYVPPATPPTPEEVAAAITEMPEDLVESVAYALMYIPDTAGSVGNSNLDYGAVTADKIADGAVSEVFQLTIPASGWEPGDGGSYKNFVNVQGILPRYTIVADVTLSGVGMSTVEKRQEVWAHIYMINCVAENQIRFYTDGFVPEIDIPCRIICLKR